MDEGVAAVRLRFPDRAEIIEDLASWDNVFCEICRDFAEAETELAKWQASSDPHGAQRCAEYRELIAGLSKEIEDALDKANVVPFHPPSAQRPR
jgi:hypothetical protein